jgi:cell wall-associated NlpC family hydrolase
VGEGELVMRLALDDPRVLELLAAWGVPYSWGAGTPRHGTTDWPDGAHGIAGGVGWDCSGFAQAALVRLGILSPMSPDRTAAALFNLCAPVIPGGERIGDLAFYGIGRISHVMVVIGPEVVFGACGGGSKTNADDPRAFVRIERLMYRADLVGIKRLVSPIESL